jgi:methionyl-tRNA formyltransferase
MLNKSLIFFGADNYSAVALHHIIENLPRGKAGWSTGILEHISVVTDHHEGGSPVEKLARVHNLDVSYYPTLPDLSGAVGLCASFDHLIPKDVISQFDGNLYNLHPSLLPQYRNVSPVQYAIALGDKETGITLFRISPGIDDGAIIAQASEAILDSDTTSTLTPRLFAKGGQLFLDAINNEFAPTGKRENGKTGKLIFTKRLKKDSGFVEWAVLAKLLAGKRVDPSETDNKLLALRLQLSPTTHDLSPISDLLRALTPWPGIWSLVPTKKGELRVSFESIMPDITLKLAGKPKAISLSDFSRYYLNN